MLANTVIFIQQNDRNTYCTLHPQAEGKQWVNWNRHKKAETLDETQNCKWREQRRLKRKFGDRFDVFVKVSSIFISVKLLLLLSFLLFCLLCMWLILHSASIFVFQTQSVTGSFLVLLSLPSCIISTRHRQTLSQHFVVRLSLIKRTSQRSLL